MHKDAPTMMTTRQAADHLGRSIRYVIRLVETQRLEPVTKLPGLRGAYLFAAADITALADEKAS